MKSKNERAPRLCAYCIHATIVTEKEEKVPLLATLKADPQKDGTLLQCRYRKGISADFSCRRFSFDPLKYRPRIAPPPSGLDEDALLLD